MEINEKLAHAQSEAAIEEIKSTVRGNRWNSHTCFFALGSTGQEKWVEKHLLTLIVIQGVLCFLVIFSREMSLRNAFDHTEICSGASHETLTYGLTCFTFPFIPLCISQGSPVEYRSVYFTELAQMYVCGSWHRNCKQDLEWEGGFVHVCLPHNRKDSSSVHMTPISTLWLHTGAVALVLSCSLSHSLSC